MPLLPTRYAHEAGPTDVCFDDSGSIILTSGKNDEFTFFKGFDDMDPEIFHDDFAKFDQAFAIVSRGPRFFVGTNNKTVDCYTLSVSDRKKETSILEFSAEVTCVAANSDGSLIAAGSDDFDVRIVVFDQKFGVAESHKLFRGHNAPILSVAVDPKDKFIASSSCDGTMKIWRIEDVACVKTVDGVVPKSSSNDFESATQLGRMSFTPRTGAHIVVAGQSKVQIYNREKWELVGMLSDPSVENIPPSIAIFSPCGSHIAVAYNDMVLIYNADTRKRVNTFQNKPRNHLPGETPTRICALQWSPIAKDAILAFCDVGGHMGGITKAFGNNDNHTAAITNKAFLLDSADSASGFSDGDGTASAMKQKVLSNPDHEENDDFSDVGTDFQTTHPVVPTYQLPPRHKMQEIVQPSSTPSSLKNRFMVYNDVGYMKMYEDMEEEDVVRPSIEVIYHNAAFHHSIHVFNNELYSLGTMNSKGYLLATEKNSKSASSRVQFCMVRSYEKDQGFSLSLEDGEWVEGIALGEGLCYVATSKRMLRVITFSGYQQYIIAIPGRFVAVAARQKLFMFAYHQSDPTADGDQCIGFSLYCMGTRRVEVIVADQRLPLSAKSTLAWLGFGLRCSPCSTDSEGIVRVFHYRNPLCRIWSPCLDMAARLKSKVFDHYFAVALDEEARHVRAILCRGATYPPTLPLPNVVPLPLETMQANMKSDAQQLEAKCTLHRLFPSKIEKNLRCWREDVLRMFAAYCQDDHHSLRAEDISVLMPTPRDMEGCFKYAAQSQKIALAERLQEVIAAVAKEEEDQDDLVVRPPSPDFLSTLGNTGTPSSKPSQTPRGIQRPRLPQKSELPIQSWMDGEDSDDSVQVVGSMNKPVVPKTAKVSVTTNPSSMKRERPPEPYCRRTMTPSPILKDESDEESSNDSGSNTATSVTSSQTMMFDDEASKGPLSFAPLPPSRKSNPFKKCEDSAPVLTRGISTMEEMTKATPVGKSTNGANVTPGTGKRTKIVGESTTKKKPRRTDDLSNKKDPGSTAGSKTGIPTGLGLEKYGFRAKENKSQQSTDTVLVEEQPEHAGA